MSWGPGSFFFPRFRHAKELLFAVSRSPLPLPLNQVRQCSFPFFSPLLSIPPKSSSSLRSTSFGALAALTSRLLEAHGPRSLPPVFVFYRVGGTLSFLFISQCAWQSFLRIMKQSPSLSFFCLTWTFPFTPEPERRLILLPTRPFLVMSTLSPLAWAPVLCFPHE